jgi:VanZ family protein
MPQGERWQTVSSAILPVEGIGEAIDMTAMGGFERVKHLVAWGSIFAIGILSLLPAANVAPIRTGIGGHLEHVVAYAATALIVVVAHLDHSRIKIAAGLLLYAASLEHLQRYSAGRLSSAFDYTFSAVGVLLGLAAFYAVRHLYERRAESRNVPRPVAAARSGVVRSSGLARDRAAESVRSFTHPQV